MMYVSERKADSICDTELALVAMKSPYLFRSWDGARRASDRCVEVLAGRAMAGFERRWLRIRC